MLEWTTTKCWINFMYLESVPICCHWRSTTEYNWLWDC